MFYSGYDCATAAPLQRVVENMPVLETSPDVLGHETDEAGSLLSGYKGNFSQQHLQLNVIISRLTFLELQLLLPRNMDTQGPEFIWGFRA